MKKLFLLLALGAFVATVAIPTNSFAASAPQEKKDEKKCDKSCSKDKNAACCKAKQDSASKSDTQKAK
jgi:hypothetical protein